MTTVMDNVMDNMIADAVDQMLQDCCDPQNVRQVEAAPLGHAALTMWETLGQSGFIDALCPQHLGGADLSWREAAPIVFACGRYALPLPMAATMLVRAALAEASIDAPPDPIAIASAANILDDGTLVANAVPYGLTAKWVLVSLPVGDRLLPLDGAARSPFGGRGTLSANIRWPAVPADSIPLSSKTNHAVCWRATAAALVAAQMAGAMQRVTAMTIDHANNRNQFGKPIGRQQAIQQQISVMAAQSFAARMAASIALGGAGWQVHPNAAAVAKARAGEAAVLVAAIGHAVHGAIGVTEEFDLQLYTRRLNEWRMEYGSESYWDGVLGRTLLQGDMTPLDFTRILIAGTHAAD